MLAQVAEYGEKMVGFIKACVKTVSRGGGKKVSAYSSSSSSSSSPEKLQPSSPSSAAYVKVACILGLRVSPSHRYCGRPESSFALGSACLFFPLRWFAFTSSPTGFLLNSKHILLACLIARGSTDTVWFVNGAL
jgi:hypothetical protein